MKRHFFKQSLLRTMMIVATLLFMMPAQKAWADNVATATVDGNTYTYSSLEAAVSAANGAQSTATVTLLKDITEQPCSLEVKKPMIIDLNNHRINTTSDNPFFIYLSNGQQMTIKNGSVRGKRQAFYLWSGEAVLENITAEAPSLGSDCVRVCSGCSLTVSKRITFDASIDNSGIVKIASGQTLYDKNGIEYSGYINSRVANLANNTLSSLVTVTANGITDTYNSLESAVSAATYAYIKYGTAATVKLNHDITQQTCSLEVKKPMIIDLNNHRINSTANFSLFYIYLSNGQQMTIKNGSIRGTEYDVYIYNGEAVLENITAEAPSSGSNCVRVCNTCTLTVSKRITFDASIYNQGYVKIASGQTLYDKNGIEYSGYINSQVANLANNTLSSLVTVTANGTTTPYNSLQDAVSAAANAYTTYGTAATITLNHDITEQPCSLEVRKPMIIDLNGHVVNADNLTYAYGIFSIMNAEGQVIIKNGTISRRGVNDYNGFAIYNYSSNLELENVTVKNTYSATKPCLYNNGTLTISKNITLVGSIKNSGTVQIVDGQLLGDASGKYYLGTLTSAQVDALSNNTLSSLSVVASGSCGTDVTWALTGTSPNYTLYISGTGVISTNPWYNYKNDITTVVINEGVTGINMSVFLNTPNLTSVTIPASVTSICQQAFDGCTNLETVSGCEGVTDVDDKAFRGTKWLTDQPDGVVYIGKVAYLGKNVSGEVNIKAGTVSISNNAFKDCTNLTSVIIPNSVTDIGYSAFEGCTSLTSITIPNSVTFIDDSAFEGCTSLTSVTIPNGVTEICESTFQGCTSLTSVTIPSSVKSIGDFAFGFCTYLASVTIPVASLMYYGVYAFDYTADGLKIYVPENALNTYKAATNWSAYEDNFVGAYTVTFGSLPDGVTGVAPSMAAEGETVTVSFSGVPDGKVPVVSVTYGDNNDNVNDIIDNGDGTFSFVMPNGTVTVTASDLIEKIPYIDADGNTAYCTNYTVLDNTMTTISAGWYVVNSDVTFSDDLSTNADDEVHIILCDGATLTANNITPIGHYDILRIYGQSQSTGTANISGRIEASSSLQIYGGTINAAGNIVCDQSGVGIHGGNVTAAKINGYEGSLYLKGGTITAGSLTIDHGDIKLGGATVTAGSYNVTQGNVTILTGITYYDGTGASYTAGNLSADQFSDIAGKILRTYDYRGGTCGKDDPDTGVDESLNVTWALTGTSPNYTLTISGTGAMKDYGAPDDQPWKDYRSSITSVVIEDGVTSIGDFAFEDCKNANLTSVTIPASVERIGDYAFGYCTYLASVTIPVASLTNYGVSAFDNTAAGLKIYVPASALSTYKAATNWSAYKDNFVGVYTVAFGSLPDGVSGVAPSMAAEGETVTVSFSGVPAGKVPGLNITYKFYDNDYDVYELKDNGDGTFSFTMPDGNVTVTASELKNDIKSCEATVPNQSLGTNSSINYKFWDTPATIGETVTDDETILTLGTDYQFGRITYADLTNHSELDMPDNVGDECLVEIKGIGNYGGSKYVRFDIVNPSGNGTWGDLSWALSNGTLTISGDGPMVTPQGNGSYPWLTYKSYIGTITIEEGVTSIADGAFATAQNDYHYAVSTVNLPSSLTSIGEDAFAYCTGATITIPTGVTSIGGNAFLEVSKVIGSLNDNADNTTLVSLMHEAKRADITISGRTLYKDGNWNTLCLPFDVDGFDYTPLQDAIVQELDVDGYYNINNPTTRYIYSYDENNHKYVYIDESGNEYKGQVSDLRQTGFDALNGTLYLYFKNASSIGAGKPYIVKWEKDSGYDANPSNFDLEDPEFTDVKVWNYATTDKAATSSDNLVQFRGIYSPTNIYSASKDNLFLGIGKNAQNEDVSMLYWPNTEGYTLGAFRAYFHVDLTETNGVRDIVLNFEDGTQTTGIIGHTDNTDNTDKADAAWYTINGVRLSAKPTAKGLYVHGNRKVVIK